MILKIWQCNPHRAMRDKLSGGVALYGDARIESDLVDCPFCIIEAQQNQITELKKELEHANQLANCV